MKTGLVLLAVALGACGDATGVNEISSVRPSLSYGTPDCYGGTCTLIEFGDSDGLWQTAYWEAFALSNDSRQMCQDVGSAISNMLDRNALYLRQEGPTSGGVAGSFDPLSTPAFPIADDDAFIKFGEAWVTLGTSVAAEDGATMAPVDKIRHEGAHTLLDRVSDPSGYTIYGDAGQGTSQTAQQISEACR